jgi:hypothetical protein
MALAAAHELFPESNRVNGRLEAANAHHYPYGGEEHCLKSIF